MNNRTALFFAAVAVCAGLLYAASPDGFAIYSKGDGVNRTLYKVSLSSDGTVGQEQKICEKGTAGGDIEGQISFDGEMIAFARSLGGNPADLGGDDYHAFGGWDIYVARIDGALPVTPVRVGHGYWPSWGENSAGTVKTLYYSVDESQQIWKATINSDGTVSDNQMHQAAGGGFMMCSPDGNYYAYRSGTNVYVKNFGTGASFMAGGGCHPTWTADSKWMIHASGHAVRNDASKDQWIHTIVGPYHYGSSACLQWFINTTNAAAGTQNCGGTVYVFTLDAGDAKFNLEKQNVLVTSSGSWCDIHAGTSTGNTRTTNHSAYSDLKLTITKTGASIWHITSPFVNNAIAEVFCPDGKRVARMEGTSSAPMIWNAASAGRGTFAVRVTDGNAVATGMISLY